MVANYLKGTPDRADPAKCKDDEAGRFLVEMTQEFEGKCGSLYCTKLLGRKPCVDYVQAAVAIIEDTLVE